MGKYITGLFKKTIKDCEAVGKVDYKDFMQLVIKFNFHIPRGFVN